MDTLTDWHIKADRTSYDRNYLLLAAVYDGEPIGDVHSKIASLAQALGETGQQAKPLTGQQGPGLVQLARQINAELLSNGSLRFPGPGFAEAVVRYFWIDRPHLINDFMKWTVGLTLTLGHEQGSRIAERPDDEKQAIIRSICKVMTEFGEKPTAEHLQETYKWQ